MLSLLQKRTLFVVSNSSTRSRGFVLPPPATMRCSSLLLLRSAFPGRFSNSRRTYIFLPDSWSETKHLLQEAWNTESQTERRAIFVKLLSRRRSRTNMNTVAAAEPTSTRRLSPKKRLILKKERGFSPTALKRKLALYYRNKRATSKRRVRETNNGAAASTTSATTTPTDSSLPRARHSIITAAGDYLHRHSHNTRAKWKYMTRRIYLSEPFEPSWFDSNGFPLTSQTPFQRYVNPWNSISTNGMQSLQRFLRWRLERLWKWVFEGSSETVVDSSAKKPSEPQAPFSTTMAATSDNDNTPTKLQLTWIGHSTCLVEFFSEDTNSSFTIITDPHFSPRASPIQMWPFGVGRAVEPALSIDQLPTTIDVAVVSHDHYDHLDQLSIVHLKSRVSFFAVPKGTGEWLMTHCGVDKDKIVELEWWESVKLVKNSRSSSRRRAVVVPGTDDQHALSTDTTTNNDDDSSCRSLTLTCAPAQHWCGRTFFDRNKRLWCSWAISSPSCSFYFGGDTGFPTDFPLFQQIGDRLGPFDLCALPIGAYAPRYFMKPSHVHPCEAVTMHQQLRSKRSVGIHHDTFQLADEGLKEPARLLQEALLYNKNVNFCTLPHGGVLKVHEAEVVASFVHEHDEQKDEEAVLQAEPSDGDNSDDQVRVYG